MATVLHSHVATAANSVAAAACAQSAHLVTLGLMTSTTRSILCGSRTAMNKNLHFLALIERFGLQKSGVKVWGSRLVGAVIRTSGQLRLDGNSVVVNAHLEQGARGVSGGGQFHIIQQQ